MADYAPPDFDTMRDAVRRMLRDPDGTVFGPDDVDDFIREALFDLDGYRPIESSVSVDWDGVDPTPDIDPINFVFMVEVNLSVPGATNDLQTIIPPLDQSGGPSNRNGWWFFNKQLRLSAYWNVILNRWFNDGQGPAVVAYGYRPRATPIVDTAVLDMQDGIDELCARKFIKAQGFQRLLNDRSLYQQWLAATNNTDTSPTQLQGMFAQANDDYERQRRRSARLRNTPVIEASYAS